ncbi:MAG: HAAS signaling domain-containing protein [Clostridium fessum]
MKKEVFLERLEALLQDIPEEEKRDAIDYYRDYLEEAGPEKEEEVLAEFQSPEHIAEVIRTELQSEWSGGEFTDRGYNDSRFEEKRTTYPEAVGQNRENEKKKQDFRLEPRMPHSGNFGMRKREKMRHPMRIKEAV